MTLISKIAAYVSRERLAEHLRDSLFKNAYFIMGGSWVTALLGFVFWIIATRYYSTEEIGVASALISAMQMLALLSTFGFHIGIIRFFSGETDKKGLINTCLMIPALGAIVLSIVYIAGLKLWTPELQPVLRNFNYGLLFVVFTVAETLFLLQRNIFIGLLASKYNFIVRVISHGIRIFLPIGLVSLGAYGIFSSVGIALWAAVFTSLVLLRRIVPGYFPRPTVQKRVVQNILHYSFGNYLAEFVNSAPNFILPLIVISLLGPEMNAYFYIAFAMAQITFTIPIAISMSLFAEGSNSPRMIRASALKAIKLMLLLQAPILIVIFFFGDTLLLLFGREYSENAYRLLMVFAVSSVPLGIIELYIAISRVRKVIRPIMLTWIMFAIVTLIASYVLISELGLLGTAVGWLVGTSVTAVVVGVVMVRWFAREAHQS